MQKSHVGLGCRRALLAERGKPHAAKQGGLRLETNRALHEAIIFMALWICRKSGGLMLTVRTSAGAKKQGGSVLGFVESLDNPVGRSVI